MFFTSHQIFNNYLDSNLAKSLHFRFTCCLLVNEADQQTLRKRYRQKIIRNEKYGVTMYSVHVAARKGNLRGEFLIRELAECEKS